MDRATLSALQWGERADAQARASRQGLVIDPFGEDLQKLGRHREARDQDYTFRNRLKSELGVTAAPNFKLATPQPAAT